METDNFELDTAGGVKNVWCPHQNYHEKEACQVVITSSVRKTQKHLQSQKTEMKSEGQVKLG